MTRNLKKFTKFFGTKQGVVTRSSSICFGYRQLLQSLTETNIYSIRIYKGSRLGQQHALQSLTLTHYFCKNIY